VESDISAVQRYFPDYEVVRNLAAIVPWPYPSDGAAQWYYEHIAPNPGKDKWVWAITEKENPAELIGIIDLWRKCCPDNRGFWLSRHHWGKGYMTEAVVVTTDYAFDFLGFEKLIFTNAIGNSRSARLKEKCGAIKIGEKDTKFVDPALTRSEIWELTKERWRTFRAT